MVNEIGGKAIKPNPALEPFKQLVGEWQIVGSHPYIPDTELHGRATVEWTFGGAFLLMRSELDHPEIPDGIEIFGSDDKAGTYYMLHFDERGVSRKYDVSITENQLKWWRDDPEFSQRFTMDIAKDRLVSYGEMSRAGGEWEQDLSLTYRRIVS
jgi:hypothetical protein